MQRRDLIKKIGLGLAGFSLLGSKMVSAKTYMTPEEAKKVLFGDDLLTPQPVVLTKEQAKSIRRASTVRVRNLKINAWRNEAGDWFILDQVIGKHENIDLAIGLTRDGKVKGMEVLVYRESYGHEIINPKWIAQLIGRDSSEVLRLDKQVKNISGATLSCRHAVDGINRLVHTWDQVLSKL